MAYKVVETELAVQDLNEILEYIAFSLANPTAASAFADEVEKCYADLERMPLMYERCQDAQLRALGYRKAVIKNYLLIYKVNETEKNVYILRFFYGGQNYVELI